MMTQPLATIITPQHMTLRSKMKEEFNMYNKKLSPKEDTFGIGRSEFSLNQILPILKSDQLKEYINLKYNVPCNSPIYAYRAKSLLRLYKYHTPIQNGQLMFSESQPDLQTSYTKMFLKIFVYPSIIMHILCRKYKWIGFSFNRYFKVAFTCLMFTVCFMYKIKMEYSRSCYEQIKVFQNYEYFQDLIEKHHGYLFRGEEPLPICKKEPNREEIIQEIMGKMRESNLHEKKQKLVARIKRRVQVEEDQSRNEPEEQEEEDEEEDEEEEEEEVKKEEVKEKKKEKEKEWKEQKNEEARELKPPPIPITEQVMSSSTKKKLDQYLKNYTPIITRENYVEQDLRYFKYFIFLEAPYVIQQYFDEKRAAKYAQLRQEAIKRLNAEEQLKKQQSQIASTHSQ